LILLTVSKRTVLPAPDQTRLDGIPPLTQRCAVVESPKKVTRSSAPAAESGKEVPKSIAQHMIIDSDLRKISKCCAFLSI
jgi:hypothetical protein